MKKIVLATVLATSALASAAHAEANRDCTQEPKAKWQSQDAMKAKGKEMGFDVRRVKVEGSCYELYGIDAKGKKMELLFNPVTLEEAGSESGESN